MRAACERHKPEVLLVGDGLDTQRAIDLAALQPPPQSLPIGQNCGLWLDPFRMFTIGGFAFAVQNGRWVVPLPIPNDKRLYQIRLMLQAFSFPATLGYLEFTNGLYLQVGR